MVECLTIGTYCSHGVLLLTFGQKASQTKTLEIFFLSKNKRSPIKKMIRINLILTRMVQICN